jgi:hypothetical protein
MGMLVSRRIRATILGLLATTMVGFVMASSALAAAGPFWHHRPIGETKNTTGEKIEPKAPENFTGVGGTQTILGEVGGAKIEIAAPSVGVTGAIFNTAHQGQAKAVITYKEPKLVKPELKECAVLIGTNNTVVAKGHLMWKWNGTKKQLETLPQVTEQTPDLVFTNVEPEEQKPAVVEDYRKIGTFTTITLKGAGCGVLAGTFSIEGSESGIANQGKVEEFRKTLTGRTLPSESSINKEAGEGSGFLQHFWNGEAYQGIIIGLKFGGNPANLIGQTEVEAAQQEVAVFEK